MIRSWPTVRTCPTRPHRSAAGRTIRLAGAALMVGLLSGCVPVLLAGLVLGGGEPSTPSGTGPFSGAAHPVQNAKPTLADGEALSSVVDQQILDSCREKLPDPPEALPTNGCSLRLSCLAGMSAPMRLRVCALPQPATGAVRISAVAAPDESIAGRPIRQD